MENENMKSWTDSMKEEVKRGAAESLTYKLVIEYEAGRDVNESKAF